MDEHIKKLMEHAAELEEEIKADIKEVEKQAEEARGRADEAGRNPCHHNTPLESKEVVVHAESG